MSETESSPVHFVMVTPASSEYSPATVKFECRGGHDAPCHSYPDCECESWDDDHEQDHPFVKHEECWMQGWFDADQACYEGPDSHDRHDNCVPAEMNRSGEIKAHYECDGYVAWDFKGASA